MEMPGCFESTKEASLLTSLGAFGQSWDVYSDIGLSVQFANGEFTIVIYNSDLRGGIGLTDQQNYGWARTSHPGPTPSYTSANQHGVDF